MVWVTCLHEYFFSSATFVPLTFNSVRGMSVNLSIIYKYRGRKSACANRQNRKKRGEKYNDTHTVRWLTARGARPLNFAKLTSEEWISVHSAIFGVCVIGLGGMYAPPPPPRKITVIKNTKKDINDGSKNWRAQFQNPPPQKKNPLLMKIEFLTSLYRITLELHVVTEWRLDNSRKYIFFLIEILFSHRHVYKFRQRNLFSQKYQKWICLILELNSSNN